MYFFNVLWEKTEEKPLMNLVTRVSGVCVRNSNRSLSKPPGSTLNESCFEYGPQFRKLVVLVQTGIGCSEVFECRSNP